MSITRRRFLGSALSSAAVFPFVRSARAHRSDVDVAIIGAGAAGLAAAKELTRLGKTVTVLEARSRIGGRVFTDRSLGVPFDVGASYIHWAERNPWRAVAREFGVELIEDGASSGPRIVYANGIRLAEAERARRRNAFHRLIQDLEAWDPAKPDAPLAALAAGGPPELAAAARSLTELSLGEEPERVSATDYDRLWEGTDYLVAEGYGTLVARYGADVPVALDTPVTTVRYDGRGVALETPSGVVRADQAVVTVPVGVLKAGSIRFEPELPASTLAALDGLAMGALTKVGLVFDGDRLGFPDGVEIYDHREGRGVVSIDLWSFGRNFGLCWLGGDHARAICEAGEEAAVDHAVSILAGVLGEGVRKHVVAGRLANWWTDRHSRGSYSVARPGRARSREDLAMPVAERLWFAGEATAGPGAMTAGGAMLEGRRVAAAVARGKAMH